MDNGAKTTLSNDDFENCLEMDKEDKSLLCLPKEKPKACHKDSWLLILKEVNGKKCPDNEDTDKTEAKDHKDTDKTDTKNHEDMDKTEAKAQNLKTGTYLSAY